MLAGLLPWRWWTGRDDGAAWLATGRRRSRAVQQCRPTAGGSGNPMLAGPASHQPGSSAAIFAAVGPGSGIPRQQGAGTGRRCRSADAWQSEHMSAARGLVGPGVNGTVAAARLTIRAPLGGGRTSCARPGTTLRAHAAGPVFVRDGVGVADLVARSGASCSPAARKSCAVACCAALTGLARTWCITRRWPARGERLIIVV
jgi:hypothetical protein